jgi:hypothetical protein
MTSGPRSNGGCGDRRALRRWPFDVALCWRVRPVTPVRRERTGCGGALHQSSRQCAGAVRRREDPDPGARPDRSGPSTATWTPRTAHPRLRPRWHDQPLRGGRRRLGPCHRRHDRSTPCCRVPDWVNPSMKWRLRMVRSCSGSRASEMARIISGLRSHRSPNRHSPIGQQWFCPGGRGHRSR